MNPFKDIAKAEDNIVVHASCEVGLRVSITRVHSARDTLRLTYMRIHSQNYFESEGI